MKRCFVISPIGQEGTEVREHADDVFDFIIKPAMDELSIHSYRADHTKEAGRITEQMFQSILEDDICIAVLTFYNPNVFYELAIAQSAARPVIILIQKGVPIPFDIRDLRVIEYDLKPRALRDRIYVNQIIDMIRSIENNGWVANVPFGNHLTPLGGLQGSVRIFDTAESFGGAKEWVEFLDGASGTLDISGVSMNFLTRCYGADKSIQTASEKGCNVRVMLASIDNPSLGMMIMDKDPTARLKQYASDIEHSISFFKELGNNIENFVLKTNERNLIRYQIVRKDDEMLVTPFLYTRSRNMSPCFRINSKSYLYNVFLEELDFLWGNSK